MIFLTHHCPFIWALILFGTKNISANLDNSNSIIKKHNKLSEGLGIFLNCIVRQTNTGVLIGNWINADFYYLNQLSPFFTVYTLDKFNKQVILYHRENYNKFHSINESTIGQKKHRARYVALNVSNSSQLMLFLENFKLSIWWDHNANFLLIDNNVQNGCNQARKFLNIIWDFNILSAVYICISSNNKLLIYTFNPFAPLAPTSWKKVESFMTGTIKSTLFQFAFDGSLHVNNSSICDKWFFDKTKHLNNHNIKAAALIADGNTSKYNDTKIGLNRIELWFNHFYTIVTSLKATATLKLYANSKYIDEHGNGQGIFKDLQDGIVDYFVPAMFIRDYWYMQSYPYDSSDGLCLSTIKIPILLVDQFLSFIDSTIFFLFLILMTVSVMLLRCFLNISVMSSVLECHRMLIGTATTIKPATAFARIFLLMNLLTFWIVNCNLNSSLNAFFTVPQYHPTIDTQDDLIKSNLKVYGRISHKQFLLHKELQDHYEVINNLTECFNRLLQAERICCFSSCEFTQASIGEIDSIRISDQNSMFLPSVRTFRKDWPLNLKYNHIISKLYEAGILDLIKKRNREYLLRNHSASIINVDIHEDKKLLTVLWLVLLWGFTLSCFTFVVEILYSKITQCDNYNYILYLKNNLSTSQFSLRVHNT